MGFTLRFLLGAVLVLSCYRSNEAISRHIRQVVDNGEAGEDEKVTEASVVANLTEESTKSKTDLSSEDRTDLDAQNSIIKLQKSETYKKATNQPEVKNTREDIGRSIDIAKYVSNDFHNKNNVYTVSVSPDTEKFIEPDYSYYRHEDHTKEYHFESELTTPKSSIFDHKYKEAVESVEQKLEHNDDSHELFLESESKESLNLEKLYDETQSNDTKANLNYINYKNIISNDTTDKNSIHKDLVVEAGTNFEFRSSYNETVIDDDDDANSTVPKEPPKEEKIETTIPKTLQSEDQDISDSLISIKTVTIPNNKGDQERSESSTTKTIILTTRKNTVLTKPPSNKNTSHISILSNNIETETVKAINPLSTTERPKGEKETVEQYTLKNPIEITKRGKVKFATTHSPVITNEITKKSEQLLQENQIVRVHVEAPSSTTVTVEKLAETTTLTATTEELTTSEIISTVTYGSSEEATTVIDQTETTLVAEKVTETTPVAEPTTMLPVEQNTTAAVLDAATTISTNTSTTSTTTTTTTPTTTTTTISTTTTSTTPTTTTSTTPSTTATTTTSTTTTSTTPSTTPSTTTSATTTSTTDTTITDDSTTMIIPLVTTLSTESAKISEENSTIVNFDNETIATTESTINVNTSTEAGRETTTEPFTSPSASDKNVSMTTQGTMRTSKGIVFRETIPTTEPLSITTELIATTQPVETTSGEIVTVKFRAPETHSEKEAATPVTETNSVVVENRTSSVPETKHEQNETTTELESTTDMHTMSSDSFNTIPPEDNSGTIAAITISTIGAVCLILLAGLLVIMRKRQKRFNYGQRCTPVSLGHYSIDNVSTYNSVRRKGDLRDSKRSYGNPAFEDPASISHPLNFPALGKFVNNVEDMKAEFEEIPQITARTNELPEGCDIKNRYANVIPLPETRVPLTYIDGYPNSDYINANYVTGPKNIKGFYIACQAPMQNTVDDFWRMIWEQQCKVVLMLTHLYENGIEKCFDYMPPSEVLDCHRAFGDFLVTLKKREVKDKYIISTLQLKNMVSSCWREVTHFWYLGWPEKGVPSEANSVIAFLIEARSYMKSSSIDRKNVANSNLTNGTAKNELNPVVVHCSPGTGRTGVVIACDIAIREFEQTRLVDIPRIVYKIRRDRASAVQTKEQYAFIYKVVNLYATKLTGDSLDSF